MTMLALAHEVDHRVDTRPFSGPMRVSRAGTLIAETSRALLVLETGLPARCYLPPGAVRPGVLIPSARRSRCPFKGLARYWSLAVDGEVVADAAWSYVEPTQAACAIKDYVCFYPNHVQVRVGGR